MLGFQSVIQLDKTRSDGYQVFGLEDEAEEQDAVSGAVGGCFDTGRLLCEQVFDFFQQFFLIGLDGGEIGKVAGAQDIAAQVEVFGQAFCDLVELFVLFFFQGGEYIFHVVASSIGDHDGGLYEVLHEVVREEIGAAAFCNPFFDALDRAIEGIAELVVFCFHPFHSRSHLAEQASVL